MLLAAMTETSCSTLPRRRHPRRPALIRRRGEVGQRQAVGAGEAFFPREEYS